MNKTLPLSRHLNNVSSLVYGCMGLGGGWNHNPVSHQDVEQTHQIIDAALECGINLFDHADIYTFGKAEQAFGQAMAARPELRDNIYLQSKCAIRFEDDQGPKRYDFSAQWISQSVDGILSRLNTEYLDVLMLHRPDPLMELDEVATAIEQLHQAGKIRHLGVSNMSGPQMAYLQSALSTPLVANQIEISLQQLDWLDQGVCNGNRAGKDINFTAGTLEYCALNNVQIQSWGSLCQGLFSGRPVDDQPQHVKATAHLVRQLAGDYQTSPEAIVLAWLMRHPVAVQPVIGTTNPDRIRACKQAADITLSREHWYNLYTTARGHELP